MRHVTYVLLDKELVQLVQSSKSTSFFPFRHVPNAWARPMTPLSLKDIFGHGTLLNELAIPNLDRASRYIKAVSKVS